MLNWSARLRRFRILSTAFAVALVALLGFARKAYAIANGVVISQVYGGGGNTGAVGDRKLCSLVTTAS
jgi:hypothetical protein